MMQFSGKKVKVITYSFEDDNFYDRKISNIMLREYSYKGLPVLALRHRYFPADLHTALDNEELSRIAAEIIAAENPDLIHVGHPMRVSELVKAARFMNIPYIVTLTDFFLICPKYTLFTKDVLCHGADGGNTCSKLCPEFKRSFITRRLIDAKEILINAKKIIAPSRFLAYMMKKEFENLDIKIINHGLNLKMIKKNKKNYKKGDEIVFCYAGSLNNHKGVHIAIDAFKKVDSQKFIFKIYGSGPDESYIKKLTAIAGNDKRIKFCGVYSEDKVSDVLYDVDVTVIPSLWYENYPFFLHESFACDVPVIASNVGGMAENIKDGVNGFLFRIGESGHLREVIERIINNPEKLNALKDNIRSRVVFSVEQEAYAYERVYRQAISTDIDSNRN